MKNRVSHKYSETKRVLKGVVRHKKNTSAMINLSLAYMQLGKPEKASKCLKKLRKQN